MEKIYTLEEYEATGNMIFVNGDFYEDFRSFLEIKVATLRIEEIEKYKFSQIYATTRETIGFEKEDLITILEEHDLAYEDYEVSDTAKDFIQEFVNTFNAKYADCSYFPNTERIILLSKDEEVQAKEYMRKLICERDCK